VILAPRFSPVPTVRFSSRLPFPSLQSSFLRWSLHEAGDVRERETRASIRWHARDRAGDIPEELNVLPHAKGMTREKLKAFVTFGGAGISNPCLPLYR